MTGARKAWVAWLAIIVPVWTVLILCTHWEPVLRDGWGHVIWHRNTGLSLAHLWDFAHGSYTHNNPRLGQIATLLQHTPGPWHVLFTPLVELALFWLMTTLVLGRWPSWRRCDDALLFATIVAMVFACVRALGPMLFYRPFTGNYLVSFTINLAWLVPYRLHLERASARRWWWVPVMLVLGAASGLGNEHTSPTLIAAGFAAIVVYWRRGERFLAWAWAGLLGTIAGTVALYLAPGQSIRYQGLATEQSVIERIVERGAYADARIVWLLLLYLAPVLLWIVLAGIARFRATAASPDTTRRRSCVVLLAMAFAIVFTLLASPKQGDRLYFASICLACSAIAGWVTARLGNVERTIAVALAAVVIAFVSWRLVATYHAVGGEFRDRLARIEGAEQGAVVIVPAYTEPRSRYFLGEDFGAAGLRSAIAFAYRLGGLELDQREPTTVPPPDDDP